MIYQQKSFFFVGAGVLLLNVFLQTRPFWGALPWWAYLLIAGALLITVASYNERSEEHTSELQSRFEFVCRLLLEKNKTFSSWTSRRTISTSTRKRCWRASSPSSRERCSSSPSIGVSSPSSRTVCTRSARTVPAVT